MCPGGRTLCDNVRVKRIMRMSFAYDLGKALKAQYLRQQVTVLIYHKLIYSYCVYNVLECRVL